MTQTLATQSTPTETTPAASTNTKRIQLSNLMEAYSDQTERLIGVELELFIEDAKTGMPIPIFRELAASLPADVRKQVSGEFLNCQIEIISTPCRTLRELRDQLQRLIAAVEKAAAKLGARLRWCGTHPKYEFDPSFVSDDPRSLYNQRRLGELTRHCCTDGVHFHVGVTKDEVIRVIDRIQAYLPLLVALSANSPIFEGQDTGRRSHRTTIWSSVFSVCGLSGPFGSWAEFNERAAELAAAGRIAEPKDLYDFVRPTRYGTVEIRCCDLPANLDQVIALAAIVQTLVVHLAETEMLNPRRRDFLRAELHEAAWKGPEASLTDHAGNLGSPQQWLTRLAYDLQPVAQAIGTDLALRLSSSVLADNGSTRQLQTLQRETAATVRVKTERERTFLRTPIAIATAATTLIATSLLAFTALLAA